MLGIGEDRRIYYVSGYTDMRSGRFTLSRVVQSNLGMDPYDGSVFLFMSKDRRKVKALTYVSHMYILYNLSYDHGYRFMKVDRKDGTEMEPVEEVGWKLFSALVKCPARTVLPI